MADINLTHTGAQLDEAIARSLQSPVDLSAVTAKAADVLEGKIIVNADGAVAGTMPNWGAVEAEATADVPYTIPAGYHNGAGVVTGSGGGAVANSIVITEVDANKRITKVDASAMTEIYPYMFWNYNSSTGAYIYLTDIIMPANITVIGSLAFKTCSNLALTSLPDSLEMIDNSAFLGCSKLKITSLPGSVTSVGSSAFVSCTGIVSMTIPDSLTVIPSSMFSYDTGITVLNLPTTLVTINNSAFRRLTALTKIWIPISCTTITGSSYSFSPFYECSSSLIIYCEAESKPAGWGAYWNYYSSTDQLTVNWGISKEAFDAL